MDHQKLFAIMSGKDRSSKALLMRAGLTCAEPFYRSVMGVRNKLFDWGVRKAVQLPRPVISVGNITTGGTGKTPMVISLAKKLLAMGEKPAVLLRGYQRVEMVSNSLDEADLSPQVKAEQEELQRTFPPYSCDEGDLIYDEFGLDVPRGIDPDRAKAAAWVLRWFPDVTVFILDDGFQRRQIHRDLDLVLVDATQPFGFGRVLPRGLLREGIGGLKRADEVVVTRSNQIEDVGVIDEQIHKHLGRPPLAHVNHQWTGFHVWIGTRANPDDDLDNSGFERHPIVTLDELKSKRVFAACGIGNPDGFKSMLEPFVGTLVGFEAYPDHHAFEDIAPLINAYKQSGAEALVVTPKDWTKIRLDAERLSEANIPVYRPILDIEFTDGETALDDLIRDRVLRKTK